MIYGETIKKLIAYIMCRVFSKELPSFMYEFNGEINKKCNNDYIQLKIIPSRFLKLKTII